MAICMRRILRKYSSLTYSSVSSQHALRDQRNALYYMDPAIEVSHNSWAPALPALNCPHQWGAKTGHGNSTGIKEKDSLKNELTLLGNNLYCDKLYLSTMFEKEMLYYAEKCDAYGKNESQKDVGSPFDKPDMAKLERIHLKLCDDLPRIFQRLIDYSVYHENMVFENNILGTRTVGIRNYLKQIAFFRMYVTLKYTSVKFEILKITTHIEDGTVRVRWRIRGVPGFKVIVLFLKEKVWRQKETFEEQGDGWFDGFSIFYVKGDGLIHKHVASKLMPKDSRSILTVKQSLVAKVAAVTGLISSDFSPPTYPELDEFVEKEPPTSSS